MTKCVFCEVNEATHRSEDWDFAPLCDECEESQRKDVENVNN